MIAFMDFIIKFLDSTLIGLLALMIPYFWIKKEKYIAGQLLVAGLWTWLLRFWQRNNNKDSILFSSNLFCLTLTLAL